MVRPASTPPIIASAIKDDDDEDRIIAELEVSAGGAAGCPSLPAPQAMPTLPCPLTRGCSRHLRGTPRDQVPGTASQASAQQRASPSSPARRQEHGAAGMGGTERLHPAGPLAGSGCCVPGSPSLFSTSTPSWALSQTHLVFNAARLQLEVCRDLCRGHPAESPPETPSRGSETRPSWLCPMSSPVCCSQGAPVGCGVISTGFPPGGRGIGDAASRGMEMLQASGPVMLQAGGWRCCRQGDGDAAGRETAMLQAGGWQC